MCSSKHLIWFSKLRHIFSESDFFPAAVTDREISQVANHGTKEQIGSADTTNDNIAFPQISILENNGQSHKQDASLVKTKYVSPQELLPLPKAGHRKTTNRGKKRGSTKITTDTPVRNEIAEATLIKAQRKRTKNFFVKRKKAKKLKYLAVTVIQI